MALQPMAYRLQAMACSVRGARSMGVDTPEARKAKPLLSEAKGELVTLSNKLKGLTHEDNESAYHLTLTTIEEIESAMVELEQELDNEASSLV